uniref:Uncharacterized protein n=1 Tax=Rhizophora mucronata TaxID=61149 RepID=A0A2P2P9H4_RHIMU
MNTSAKFLEINYTCQYLYLFLFNPAYDEAIEFVGLSYINGNTLRIS